MCFELDPGLVAAALVLAYILALLLAFRVWIACGDYLLRRRITLPQLVGRSFSRFEDRLAERVFRRWPL